MGAESDRGPDTSLDDQPSKSSFFSRLSLPLRSRTRNLTDFHVRPDEPHRHYSAGDHVTGSIVLTVIKPIRITHLTVALHGFVRVFKSAGAAAHVSAPNPAVVSNDSGKNYRYHGSGQASLFQDEQVLCGEGRLAARRWEFKFDLIFPSKGLPSSIDFERGTISYMITATLTRPSSIGPTLSTEAKVSLTERVDIGLVPTPRERRVTMHAMHKRSRRKKRAVVPNRKSSSPKRDTQEQASDADSARAHESSRNHSPVQEDAAQLRDVTNIPRSPVYSDRQSEFSEESAMTNNSAEDREISATVELSKGGCLPGDVLSVRIGVDHNRRMKSLHGVIVTFYRQGRVDYAPPASLGGLSYGDTKGLERDEYLPKSKTGLSGLSLSSAGSCSVFRKDLSQAVAPLIIDPTTLSANVSAAVRVPEDAFPSIRNVPSGLISFRYYVEVVVDLGGKLGGQAPGGSAQPSVSGSGAASSPNGSESKPARFANWSGTIVNTDHIRRTKGVISVNFEILVGTTDSSRARGKAAVRPTSGLRTSSVQERAIEVDDLPDSWQNGLNEGRAQRGVPDDGYRVSQEYYPPGTLPQAPYYDYLDHESAAAPIYIPPPETPDQSALSEKERVRQAEQRLLPSQPRDPQSASGPSGVALESPSTPYPAPPLLPLDTGDTGEGPSAPTLADLSSTMVSPTDDKQELERRRLLLEASAPPEMPQDYDDGEPSAPPLNAPAGSSPTDQEPSAPVLDEGEFYGRHDPYGEIAGPSAPPPGHDNGAEPLPKYER